MTRITLRAAWAEYATGAQKKKIEPVEDPIGQMPEYGKELLKPRRYKCLLGGRGCIAGDTLIETPEGPIEVRDFQGGEVYSFDGHQRTIAIATAPVRYNPEPLYKVSFGNGKSIEVTAKHRFLTGQGWLQASQLSASHDIFSFSQIASCDSQDSYYSFDLSESLLGARRWWQRLVGFLYGYSEYLHQCGLLPPPDSETYRDALQRLTDGQLHSLHALTCWDAKAIAYTNTLSQFLRRLSTEGAQLLSVVKSWKEKGNYNGAKLSELPSAISLTQQLSHEKNNPHEIIQELSRCALGYGSETNQEQNLQATFGSLLGAVPDTQYSDNSYNNPFCCNHPHHSSESLGYKALEVISIEYSRTDYFYDFFVPFFNNYLTEGGVVNHNSGKSFAVADALLIIARERPCTILCCREYQNSIRDSSYALLTERITALGFNGEFDVLDSTIRHNETGSKFIFKGLRRNIGSILSMAGITHCWVEEAQYVNQDSWRKLTPTIRDEGSELWVTFNPKFADDPVYKEFVVSPDPDAFVKKVNWYDNPYFTDELEAERQKTLRVEPDEYEHIWNGEISVKSDAQIFNGKWEVDEFEPGDDWQGPYFGADFGYIDPSACVKLWVHNERLYVEHESYHTKLDIEQTADMWIAEVPGCNVFQVRADSSQPAMIGFLERNGLPGIVGAKKGPGSIESGIAFMRHFEKIIVHPRCEGVQKEMRLYSYKVDEKAEEVLPVIVDRYNHCLVPGTMVTTEHGQVAIESVKAGDRVLTRKGYKRVLWSGESDQNRQVFEVKTKGGKSFEATENHKIFTLRGWVRVDSLRYDDEVLTLGGLTECASEKLSNTVGLSGLDTLKQTTELAGFTTHLESRKEQAEKKSCIAKFGSMLTGQSQRAITSITRTMTRVTTRLRTLNAFQPMSTCPLTQGDGTKRIESKSLPTWKELDRSQLLGIHRQKGRSCMTSSPKTSVLSAATWSQQGANAAEPITTWTTLPKATQSSAQTNASQGPDGHQALIMSPGNVNGVAVNSLATNTAKQNVAVDRVSTVIATRTSEKVYDLTVEDQHEFFANGVLVHNCLDSARYALEPLMWAWMQRKQYKPFSAWGEH